MQDRTSSSHWQANAVAAIVIVANIIGLVLLPVWLAVSLAVALTVLAAAVTVTARRRRAAIDADLPPAAWDPPDPVYGDHRPGRQPGRHRRLASREVTVIPRTSQPTI